jgi:plasmid maintenance system antidote protein VapI
MEKHHGRIIEQTVRSNNISITGLARQLNVNRSKVYEWFEKKELAADLIYKIGTAINHDFTKEFPELFPKNTNVAVKSYQYNSYNSSTRVEVWKDKYIGLLEKYMDLLS